MFYYIFISLFWFKRFFFQKKSVENIGSRSSPVCSLEKCHINHVIGDFFNTLHIEITIEQNQQNMWSDPVRKTPQIKRQKRKEWEADKEKDRNPTIWRKQRRYYSLHSFLFYLRVIKSTFQCAEISYIQCFWIDDTEEHNENRRTIGKISNFKFDKNHQSKPNDRSVNQMIVESTHALAFFDENFQNSSIALKELVEINQVQ